MKKSKWEKQSLEAITQLEEARKALSRAGLYLTSLLLSEVVRVSEYELYSELERYKELRNKKGKKK